MAATLPVSHGGGFDIIPAPGLLTDQSRPIRPDGTDFVDLTELRGYGYDWISYQAVNGVTRTGIEISGGRQAGFPSVGVWGVVYQWEQFHEFGRFLGLEANRLGADHVIVDAEECAKGTRANRGLLPIIVGCRDGGWLGPVHLCPLGAPVNAIPHGPNDFAVDSDDFLATGGGVLPQAYYNAYDEYAPWLCADYWQACGVPADRLNLMIDLAVEHGSAKEADYTGAEWAAYLDRAVVARNLSVFMVQFGTDADWAGLEPHTRPAPAPEPPQPEPEPEDEMEPVTDQQGRDGVMFAVQAAAQNWTAPKPKGRLTVCGRIASPGNSDDKWNQAREEIVPILDKYGIELPD